MVNAAITGMVGMPRDVPGLPVTTERIARDAWVCHQLGASILHLHARDDEGQPDWRPEAWSRLITAVRERCPEAVLCASTSGRSVPELERRASALTLSDDVRPDMASLTLGSLDFAAGPSVNAPETVRGLAKGMREAQIKPELEVFDSGMASVARSMLESGECRRRSTRTSSWARPIPARRRCASSPTWSIRSQRARSGQPAASAPPSSRSTRWRSSPAATFGRASRTTCCCAAGSRRPTRRWSPASWRSPARPGGRSPPPHRPARSSAYPPLRAASATRSARPTRPAIASRCCESWSRRTCTTFRRPRWRTSTSAIGSSGNRTARSSASPATG